MTDAIENVIMSAENSLRIEAAALQELLNGFKANIGPAIQILSENTGMTVLTGMGKAGFIAAKVAASLSSTGTPAYFLHAADSLHGDSGSLRAGDVVIAISNSGETAEVIQVCAMAKSWGCKVISMTQSKSSTLGKLSDHVIELNYEMESDPLNMAPTTSAMLALAAGDALVSALITHRSFTPSDFKSRHPGGSLGKAKI